MYQTNKIMFEALVENNLNLGKVQLFFEYTRILSKRVPGMYHLVCIEYLRIIEELE